MIVRSVLSHVDHYSYGTIPFAFVHFIPCILGQYVGSLIFFFTNRYQRRSRSMEACSVNVHPPLDPLRPVCFHHFYLIV